MIERADKVINLLRLDELCDQLKEFQNADFHEGYRAALRNQSFIARATEDQADGGWGSKPTATIPELHRRLQESLECVGVNKEEVEESPWLVRFKDCDCVWDERNYSIALCKDHAHLVNEPDSSNNLHDTEY